MHLSRRDILERWVGARNLQMSIDAVSTKTLQWLEDARRLRGLETAFGKVFPCPHALRAFWSEVRHLSWATTAGESPWDSLAAMAYDLETQGTLTPSYPSGPKLCDALIHLRLHAQQAWERQAESEGFSYAIQEISSSGLSTAVPAWAETVDQVVQAVRAGHRPGLQRWAMSVAEDEVDDPQFLCGLNAQGKPMRAPPSDMPWPYGWAMMDQRHDTERPRMR